MMTTTITSFSPSLLHVVLPPPSSPFCHKLQPPNTFHIHKPTTFTISASSSSSSSSSWEREETRWLREEERWVREEARWLREQSRWSSERQSLLEEINNLKNKIQQPRPPPPTSVGEVVVQKQIPETGSGPVPLPVEKEVVVLEETKKRKKAALRSGAQGEEVLALQEALLKLGFYSGEEDMEFSSFSSGTERAVKAWQASLGAPEDGIVTAELLEKLFMEQGRVDGNSSSMLDMESENGATVPSVSEVSAIKQIVVKERSDAEFEASHHHVFLLGENRWEDSSRLLGREKQVGGSTIGVSTTKCISCRGEGHILCTECDGTGEPNVEAQFLEWVDEGAKCPYCEGLGYNICDVCEGKTIIHA